MQQMKRLTGLFVFLLIGCTFLQAQIPQQAVQQFRLLKNIRYSCLSTGSNIFTGERSRDSSHALLSRQTDGSWAFKITGKTQIKWYADHKRVIADLEDKTYRVVNDTISAGNIALPTLALIMDRLSNDLSKGYPVSTLPDSVIAGKKYHHFRVTQLDSTAKGKKIYSATSFVLDKKTLLPYAFRQDGLGFIDGTDMYVTQLDEYSFANYTINSKNFPNLSALMVPEGFKAAKPKQEREVLQKGETAPEITLQDMKGKNTKLSNYKGKVVLVSFTDNGCGYCGMSVTPANEILARYKDRDFILINVNPFDSPDAILNYNKRFKVNYDSYKPGKSAVQDYRVNGYPNFFVIDKDGKIAKVIDGFSTNLEKKLSDAIESVL
jgi:cytochrome oxidase Cu insertion factor (SCO1/SenC/PrrC family)